MGVVKYSQLLLSLSSHFDCSMDPFLEFQEGRKKNKLLPNFTGNFHAFVSALPWQSMEKTKGWAMVSTLSGRGPFFTFFISSRSSSSWKGGTPANMTNKTTWVPQVLSRCSGQLAKKWDQDDISSRCQYSFNSAFPSKISHVQSCHKIHGSLMFLGPQHQPTTHPLSLCMAPFLKLLKAAQGPKGLIRLKKDLSNQNCS